MQTFLLATLRSHRGAPRTMLSALLILLTTACTAISPTAPVPAQDTNGAIDQLFSWATEETPGCAVAVSQNGEVVVNRAYGLANLESKEPITTNTRFDIGSVQKQFVATAILLLVEDELLSLTDDIRTYFPEMPDFGHTITVDHLLTHTSGIRDWTALLSLSNESEDALTMILRQRGLNFAPGEAWSYSNSGYVLLKELIARTTGMTFSEFAQERLFEPLGMESTTYAQDVGEIEDRALAYEKEDSGWELTILVGNERGDGGALLSTASDLLIWNEALTNASLGEFVTEKLQEPATLNNGRELSYARGLFLDEDPASRIVWHTGSAAAYKSSLARLIDLEISLALLCNAGERSDGLVNPIVDLFISDVQEPDTAHPSPVTNTPNAIGAPAPDPTDKAGVFFSERTGELLRLVVQEGKLRVGDGPELLPVAQDRYRNERQSLYFMSDDKVELHFLSSDEFTLTTSHGEEIHYRRAEPNAPTAVEAEAFVGQYGSDELNASLAITFTEESLHVSLNNSPLFAFTPVARDTFQLGAMLMRFQRDDNGHVVGLDYSNPVVRNVRFTKSSNATEGS